MLLGEKRWSATAKTREVGLATFLLLIYKGSEERAGFNHAAHVLRARVDGSLQQRVGTGGPARGEVALRIEKTKTSARAGSGSEP